MTTPEREILAFIAKNQPVAQGTLRDCFPAMDIESILERLKMAEQVRRELRPTIQGQQDFYSTNKNAPSVGNDQPAGHTKLLYNRNILT